MFTFIICSKHKFVTTPLICVDNFGLLFFPISICNLKTSQLIKLEYYYKSTAWTSIRSYTFSVSIGKKHFYLWEQFFRIFVTQITWCNLESDTPFGTKCSPCMNLAALGRRVYVGPSWSLGNPNRCKPCNTCHNWRTNPVN